MEKKELRQEVIKEMKAFAKNRQKPSVEKTLHQRLFACPQWQRARAVGLTYAMDYEINTLPIIEKAWSEGKTVALPRVMGPGVMEFFKYLPNQALVKSAFGVWEPNPTSSQPLPPDELDLLLVPGVAFHESGKRVGFGGGFYDRYLARFAGPTISLALPLQQRNDWEPDVYDIAIETLLTI